MRGIGPAAAVLLGILLPSQAAIALREAAHMNMAGRVGSGAATTALAIPRFTSPAWIVAGKNPSRLIAADLNSDGKPDLATVAWDSATLSVMSGDGTGQFSPRRTYGTGRRPVGLVASDLNRDGRLDLVTASSAAVKSITVHINRGANHFPRSASYAAGRGAYAVAAGDVNRDGLVDLLSAHAKRRHLTVLLGRRAGGFRAAYRYRGGEAYDLALADLNRDGRLDVVLADSERSAATVRLGRGDGRFGRGRAFRSGLNPFGVAVADLNDDGVLDIVVANYGNAGVSVLLGAGDGSFGARTRYRMGASVFLDYVDAVVVADFDRDGHLDMATPSSEPSVRRGRGDGTFDKRQRVGGRAFTQSASVADFNGDGWPDLAFSEACDAWEGDCDNYPALSIAVMLNWSGLPVKPCVVPQLVNPLPIWSADERGARRWVTEAGCRVGHVRHRYSRRGSRGTVIRQWPQSGAVRPHDSRVNFVVSRGRRH